MYARIVTITGAKNIDDGISFLRENLLPIISDQKGYRGLSISVDRPGGVLGVLSLWDTVAERDASWDALAQRRQEGLGIIGGQLGVQNYEQLLLEEGNTPPAPGSALMLRPISMEPAKIDENFAFFRSDVLPQITASQGFQAARVLMNRETGAGMVGTAWTDEDAMRAAAADAQARREQGMARGVQFGDVSYREIALADLR
jgi:heme-degrading monooxygenase HmoA